MTAPINVFADTPFEGDGREMLDPMDGTWAPLPNGTRPAKLTRATARRVVLHFLSGGASHHSPSGSTMWVLIAYARLKGMTVTRRSNSLYLTSANQGTPNGNL